MNQNPRSSFKTIPYKPTDEQKKCHHINYRDLNRKERRAKHFKKINAVGICLDCKLLFISAFDLTFGGDENVK